MSTPQSTLLDAIREEVANTPERVPKYQQELLATLADIVQFERENRVTRIAIREKVREKCEALAKFVERSSAGRETSG